MFVAIDVLPQPSGAAPDDHVESSKVAVCQSAAGATPSALYRHTDPAATRSSTVGSTCGTATVVVAERLPRPSVARTKKRSPAAESGTSTEVRVVVATTRPSRSTS